MIREARFSPEAIEQLDEIEAFISAAGSPVAATAYIDAIVDHCATLGRFPLIGVSRDDLYPGLRITHHKGRAVIAYVVGLDTVIVLGIFYGGRDISAFFSTDEDNL